MSERYINKIKVGEEYYNFDAELKTINGESIIGEGDIAITGGIPPMPAVLWSGSTVIASSTSETTVSVPEDCKLYKMLIVNVTMNSKNWVMYIPNLDADMVESGILAQENIISFTKWDKINNTFKSRLGMGSYAATMTKITGV